MHIVFNHIFPPALFSGQVEYSHEKGEPGGSFAFNFDVIDAEGNKLMDQSFYISVLGKRWPT